MAALLLGRALQAEGVVDTCTETAFETAFDQALVGGGLVTLKCSAATRLSSVKTIAVDTVISNATQTGSLTGTGSNRFFHILPGVTLTLHNLHLKGGRADGADGADGTRATDAQDGEDSFGGAIFNEGGFLVATNVTFEGNEARGGKGGRGADVEQLGGQPSPGGSGGHGHGGALYSNGGTNILARCTFKSNRAEGGRGGDGGSGEGYLRDGADGGHGGESAGGAVFLSNGASLQASQCRFEGNASQGAQGGAGGRADGLAYFDGAQGKSTLGQGGGLCQEDSTSILSEACVFSENSAVGANGLDGSLSAGNTDEAGGQHGLPGRGGAIVVTNGSLTVNDSTFSFNRADGGVGGEGGLTAGAGDGGNGGSGAAGQGAAIHVRGDATVLLADSSFSGNSARGGFGGFGTVGLTELTITGEDGSAGPGEGGALHFGGTSMSINRCTFTGNEASGGEGLEGLPGNAFRMGNDGSTGGRGSGGALHVVSGSLGITNSTFHANAAVGGKGGNGGKGGSGLAFATDGGKGGNGGAAEGGALWTGSAIEGAILHATFANNRVSGGAGGNGGLPGDTLLAEPGAPGQVGSSLGASLHSEITAVRLRGTLLAGPDGADNASGRTVDEGFNQSSDATPPYLPPSTSQNFVEPLLDLLSNNGGPTRTMALKDGSPAIDFAEPPGSLSSDQRGLARDERPDTGAYEVATHLPPLAIAPSNNAVVLSWPATGPVYTLEAISSLKSTNWVTVTGAILNGDHWSITIVPNQAERYFQLRH